MKENLILAHSFPTNSILLRGLIEYLQDYFSLYFIDLPGFTERSVPDQKISYSYFSSYVSSKIKELNLDSFIIGGISFGFAVANNADFDLQKCKAVIAIEPYLGEKFLHLGFMKRFIYSHLVDQLLAHPNLLEKIWDDGVAEKALSWLTGYDQDRTHVMISEINSQVFFQTAKLIMETEPESIFKNLPYVLLINKEDGTVDSKAIVQEFQEHVSELFVKYTDIEHYPKNPTKEYFQSKLSQNDLEEIILWINSQKITEPLHTKRVLT